MALRMDVGGLGKSREKSWEAVAIIQARGGGGFVLEGSDGRVLGGQTALL